VGTSTCGGARVPAGVGMGRLYLRGRQGEDSLAGVALAGNTCGDGGGASPAGVAWAGFTCVGCRGRLHLLGGQGTCGGGMSRLYLQGRQGEASPAGVAWAGFTCVGCRGRLHLRGRQWEASPAGVAGAGFTCGGGRGRIHLRGESTCGEQYQSAGRQRQDQPE
jgi:hypothetical protein